MNDAPLFQDSDEQEAAYAPQELAAGDPAARHPGDTAGERHAATATAVPMIPIPNPTGLGGGASAGTIGATTAGSAEVLPVAPRATTAEGDTDAANRRPDAGGSTPASS